MTNVSKVSTLSSAYLSAGFPVQQALSIDAATDIVASLRSGNNEKALEAAEQLLATLTADRWDAVLHAAIEAARATPESEPQKPVRRHSLGYLEGKGSLSREEALSPPTEDELRLMGLAD